MVLKSDKDRLEFVQNALNWETVGTLNNIIRLSILTYGDEEWYALDIRQIVPLTFNGMTSYSANWKRIGIFRINEDVRAFTFALTEKQITDEIKRIDKENRHK